MIQFAKEQKSLWSFIKSVWLPILVTLLITISLSFSLIAHGDTTHSFSGILKDQNGNVIKGVTITLRDTQNHTFTAGTSTTGSFSVVASPGIYSLKIWTSSPANQSGLGQFSLAQPISTPSIDLTSTDITQNLTLPVATVNYTVYNAQGYGDSNVTLGAGALQSNVGSAVLYPGGPTSSADAGWGSNTLSPFGGAAGVGQFKTIAGTNFPANSISTHWQGTSVYLGNTNSFTATDGIHIDLPNTPLPNNIFSGVYKDSTGTAITSAQFKLQDAYNNVVTGNTTTGGGFSLAVRPGMYSLTITVSGTTNAPFGSYQLIQPVTSPSIDLTAGNVSQDLTLPVGTVNFTVYDLQGHLAPSYSRVTAAGRLSSPISLYPGGVGFQLPTTISHLMSAGTYSTGSFKSIVGVTYQGTGTNNGLCSYTSSNILMNCNTAPLVVAAGTNTLVANPRIATPSSLSAATPTPLPNLSWQSVTGASQYFIYRDNNKIGTSSSTSFIDNIGNGTYNYQVSAVDANGVESFLSINKSVTVVQIAPNLSQPALSSNPVFLGQTSVATVNVVGNLYGVSSGEYFIGTDPGQGNGTAMSYSNGTFTASLSGLATGNYTISFRAKNNIGWSQIVTTTLNITKPTFSGILKDQNGNVVRGVTVTLRDSQNSSFSSSLTGTDGSFSLQVTPGLYSLKISTSSPVNQSGLGQFSLTQPISSPSIDLTTSNVTQNLTLPIGTVNYTVYNAQGYGDNSVTLSTGATQSNVGSVSLYPGSPNLTADAPWTSNTLSPFGGTAGQGQFKTIVGTYIPAGSISVHWQGTSIYAGSSDSLTVIDGYNYINLPNTPQPNNSFSGTFKDSTGVSITGAQFSLQDAYNNVVTGTTNSGGFNLAVRPGIYSLSITNSVGTVNYPFGSFQLKQDVTNPSLDLTTGDLIQDLTLPVGIVNYTAYTPTGSTTSYGKVKAYGTLTAPVSLYSGGNDFESTTGISHNLSSDAWGSGTFKSIIGANYASSGTNTLCYYYDSSVGALPTTCSLPLTIATGTNTATINQTP